MSYWWSKSFVSSPKSLPYEFLVPVFLLLFLRLIFFLSEMLVSHSSLWLHFHASNRILLLVNNVQLWQCSYNITPHTNVLTNCKRTEIGTLTDRQATFNIKGGKSNRRIVKLCYLGCVITNANRFSTEISNRLFLNRAHSAILVLRKRQLLVNKSLTVSKNYIQILLWQ